MKLILAIAAGGALGAVGRHYVGLVALRLAGTGFPLGTLTVNVVGSLAMGLLIELLALQINLSQEARGFLTVGLLGAFTTFSTFSLETALLFERGQLGLAGLYVVLSFALSLGGLFAGMNLVRWVLA